MKKKLLSIKNSVMKTHVSAYLLLLLLLLPIAYLANKGEKKESVLSSQVVSENDQVAFSRSEDFPKLSEFINHTPIRDEHVSSKYFSKKLLLGSVDLALLDENDLPYLQNAKIFTDGDWTPFAYQELRRYLYTPEYQVSLGDKISENIRLRRDLWINLECGEIVEDHLAPPYLEVFCKLSVNGQELSDLVASRLTCVDDGQVCDMKVEMAVYTTVEPSLSYLLFRSYDISSPEGISVYALSDNSFNRLNFADDSYLSDMIFIQDMNDLYMANIMADGSHRLVIRYNNPGMISIDWVYLVMEITESGLVLEDKVVQISATR